MGHAINLVAHQLLLANDPNALRAEASSVKEIKDELLILRLTGLVRPVKTMVRHLQKSRPVVQTSPSQSYHK